MDTSPPLAARFFFALATLLAFAGAAVMLLALFGDRWVLAQDSYALEALLGIPGVVYGILLLLGAGGAAAFATVIHDLRRIAVNTAPETFASTTSFDEGESDARARPVRIAKPHLTASYYYVQDGTEHGPVNHARMTRLLRTKGADAFTRIERSVDGVREAVDPREFGV